MKTEDLRIKNKLRSKSFSLQIDRGDCQLQFPPRLVVVRSYLVELPANNREYAKVRMRANRVVDSFLLVARPNCYIFRRKKISKLVTSRGTTFTLVDVRLSCVFLRKPWMCLKIDFEKNCVFEVNFWIPANSWMNSCDFYTCCSLYYSLSKKLKLGWNGWVLAENELSEHDAPPSGVYHRTYCYH